MIKRISHIILLSMILISTIFPMLTQTITFAATGNSTNGNVTIPFVTPGANANVSSTKVINFIHNLTFTIMEVGWGIFILAFAVGWLIRGSPVPFYEFKEQGHRILYDAILGAFFLALGSTIFYLISTITGYI